jgi:hypothetical protein
LLVENYSDSRQVSPVGFLAVFECSQKLAEGCSARFFERALKTVLCAGSNKLTWLALGEDQAARSRRVEQLTAL